MVKQCNVCFRKCNLEENQEGFCRGRKNLNGKIVPLNYGSASGIALDPIEKKPLRRFYPGSKILSVGSFGCNLKCQFCQNYDISMKGIEAVTQNVTPESLVEIALDLVPRGNIGIAYTYNEPLIGYEFVRDCSELAKKRNLKNVVVTNGCFNTEILNEILPNIDAFNIDLKGFTEEFYNKIGGDLETVKKFIKTAAISSHVEITTLIIPDENDSEHELRKLSQFIASVSPDIPLHISRFFPCYKMSDKKPTKVSLIYNLANIARKSLNYVYEGNC